MSAAALYRSMGLKGFEVEDNWEGKNGALFVSVSVPVSAGPFTVHPTNAC